MRHSVGVRLELEREFRVHHRTRTRRNTWFMLMLMRRGIYALRQLQFPLSCGRYDSVAPTVHRGDLSRCSSFVGLRVTPSIHGVRTIPSIARVCATPSMCGVCTTPSIARVRATPSIMKSGRRGVRQTSWCIVMGGIRTRDRLASRARVGGDAPIPRAQQVQLMQKFVRVGVLPDVQCVTDEHE